MATSGSDPFAGTAYRAIQQLGSGGMGAVWLVEHLELGKRFVAKLIHERLAGDAQLVDRVRLEAQSLGRLNHPNVVAVAGFDLTREGRPFIVMEYLRGATLGAELAARRFTIGEAVAITRQLLSALSSLHALGLVHRDLKPDNLFLDRRNDGAPVLKVLDFGVVRVLPGVSPLAPMPLRLPTQSGVVVGTPRYVSPEAARGVELDERADLYAAGLVLYRLLAGRGPFDHLHAQDELLHAHAHEAPAPPSAFAAEPVPAELDRLVLGALDKDPNRRFQSAADFDAALGEVVELLDNAPGWLRTTAFDAAAVAETPKASPRLDLAPEPTKPTPPARVVARVAALVALVVVAAIAGIALVRALRLMQGAG